MSVQTSDLVSAAFDKIAQEKSKYKSISVEKLIDLEYDLGTLLAIDTNEINSDELRSNREHYLLNLARDNTQLLLNKCWRLPFYNVDDAMVVKLPKPTYLLPREKPLPKVRPPTRFEQYAKEKGFQIKKKPRYNWDDVLKKWVPSFGYRKVTAEKEKNWLIEIPDHVNPYEDPFEKMAAKRKNKIAKNEFQRLRNIANAHNIEVPRMGVTTNSEMTAGQLNVAASLAKTSTASLGKFQPSIRSEKKRYKETPLPGTKKQKLTPMTINNEITNNVDILKSIFNKKPKLDISKAVGIHHRGTALQARETTSKQSQTGKRGKKRSFGNKKSPSGDKRRHSSKKNSGTKRRK